MIRIERVAVGLLNPARYNPRRDLLPGDPEYERLKKSINEFGCVEPLVWNRATGNLVGGHQRLRVLIEGGATEVDVSVVELSPEREKALNIALNKISGEWDNQRLAALLDELVQIPEFDLELTGFTVPEAGALIAEFGNPGGADDEKFDLEAALREAELRRGPPVTRPGELIVLGREPALSHRLVCGDSTDPAQIRFLMDGQRAALFATDPPYLVGYDGSNHPGAGTSKNKNWADTYGVTWDDADGNPELYDKFVAAAVSEALRPDAAWYCWHASRRQAMLESVWNAHGAFAHCQIIWCKNRPVLTRTWYMWQHEPCLMGWLKGKKPPRATDQHLATVWHIDTLSSGPERPDHPTPKPVEIFRIPIRQHTQPAEVCYEPFAGSGSQVLAAQSLGRRCFAAEISPHYCDLIVRRFIASFGTHSVAPMIAERYAEKPASMGPPPAAASLKKRSGTVIAKATPPSRAKPRATAASGKGAPR